MALFDGERLVDLLIQHGIGVRRRTVEVLEMDTESLRREAEAE